jgi:hypothetical protein
MLRRNIAPSTEDVCMNDGVTTSVLRNTEELIFLGAFELGAHLQ